MDKDYIKGLLWGLFFVAIIHLLFGCSRTVYVPLEKVSHDTTYLSKVRYDSVYFRDSIYLFAHTTNDTVYRDKTVYRYVYKAKTATDTVYSVKCDTICVPVTTVREASWWERTKAKMFVPLAVACVLLSTSVWWNARNR